MTSEEIVSRITDETTSGIYGYMYGHPLLNYGDHQKPDEVIFIDKQSLRPWTENGKTVGFLFVWGFPGPDYNVYFYKDYGVTWAFSPKEIEKPVIANPI